MRRLMLASVLAAVAALLCMLMADSGRRKAVAAPPAYGVSAAPDDFLLLHEGDSVRVMFRDDAGPGSIRFLSLSDESRLDIFQHSAGAEQYVFRREQGWQTYPLAVGGHFVTIVLRERGDATLTGELPGCSDVVLRVENAAILTPHHTDVGGPDVRCELCDALLDW